MEKIRIAFIHQTGLFAGGTEMFLQRLAVNLPKDKYEVDYYYAKNTSPAKKKYVEENGVQTIQFDYNKIVEKKGVAVAFGCNLKEVFKDNYDLIQLGTDGANQNFLHFIRNTPIIDSIHYVSGSNNRYHVSRVMHISQFSKNKWIAKGGDPKRVEMISLPLKGAKFNYKDIRESLGLDKDCFLFGMHQANRDEIFSDIPLRAYKEVESDNNAFVLLNGSKLYREQAKQLGLKRVFFYDFVESNDEFWSILNSLNVYTHGRKDGELNSAAIAEALSLGKPVITHPSDDFNGHLEVITKDIGVVANDYKEYALAMRKLEDDPKLCKELGANARNKFLEHYDFDGQMANIQNIYVEALKNPYPNKADRVFRAVYQRVKDLIIKLAIVLLYR